jgi:hypothetical protein
MGRASQMFDYRYGFRSKGLFQFLYGEFGPGVATHENIEGGEAVLRPGVDADVGFGEHGDPGKTSAGRKAMQMNVQQGGPGFLDTGFQNAFHQNGIIQFASAPEIQNQVLAGIDSIVVSDKMIFGASTRLLVNIFGPSIIGVNFVEFDKIAASCNALRGHRVAPLSNFPAAQRECAINQIKITPSISGSATVHWAGGSANGYTIKFLFV